MSDILDVIKAHRLEWLGHVLWMAGEGAVKKLLASKPGGGSKKGRPRLSWTDVVKLDLMNLGVEMWRTRALERIE